jgi:AcrR family transcriptional regulator
MSSSAGAESENLSDGRLARGRATRAQLLAAAADVLGERGFAAASMRVVAERAGVRLSLVQYHFGTRQGLLVAVLADQTERLLARQAAMFADGRPFSEQWRTACEYLREDIRTGYVRILWELWAASLADEALAEQWRATQRGWRGLILERLERCEAEGVRLPMSARALATLIANLFEGAETEILGGVGEDEAPHLEALLACADLLARLEQAS